LTLQPTLYDGARLTVDESIELTAQSLAAYGRDHDHWCVAWSGGKDSTTLVTVLLYLIESGRVPRPRRLTVLYADTRMELPPLADAAARIGRQLSDRGCEVRTVVAPLDQRYFVYILGRGVPPPNNNTLRWCTAQIKVEPMEAELRRVAAEGDGKPLMLIGVRVGESAARDARIAIACGRNGAECGQGWYQRDLPDAVCDKLSPILHWRTCLVWDWLNGAGDRYRHGFDTSLVAEAYGAESEGHPDELGARTGCMGCPLATKETALDNLLKSPRRWGYLAPLRGLRPIYRELREPRNRLRQPPGETRKDGTLIGSQNRMGPLTMTARLDALDRVLAIQAECNRLRRACGTGIPPVDLLNAEEEARIRELIAADTWPQRWSGSEPAADELYEDQYADGSRQLLLPTVGGKAVPLG
jgi:DNA sulfur modification protein DndC